MLAQPEKIDPLNLSIRNFDKGLTFFFKITNEGQPEQTDPLDLSVRNIDKSLPFFFKTTIESPSSVGNYIEDKVISDKTLSEQLVAHIETSEEAETISIIIPIEPHSVDEAPPTDSRDSRLYTDIDNESIDNALNTESFSKQKSSISQQNAFVCDECGKIFTLKGNFKQHCQTHTGERPFACDVCDKKFAAKSNLKQHSLLRSNKKSYECNICKKNFTQLSGLNIHMRRHIGVKPFHCEFCGKNFPWSSELSLHLKRYHKIRSIDYKGC